MHPPPRPRPRLTSPEPEGSALAALGKGWQGRLEPRWMRPADQGTERPWVSASQMLLGYPSGISERCNLHSIMMPGPLEAEGCGSELSGYGELMSRPEKAAAGLAFGLNKSASCSGHWPPKAKPKGHPHPQAMTALTDQGGCVLWPFAGGPGRGSPGLGLEP